MSETLQNFFLPAQFPTVAFGASEYMCGLAVALLVLFNATSPGTHGRRLFLVNVLVVGLFTRWGVLLVFAFVFGLRLLLKVMESASRPQRFAAGGYLFLVGAFVAYRVHPTAPSTSYLIQSLVTVGTAIGFAFVALRAAYVLRAHGEDRLAPPTFVGLFNYLFPINMLLAGPIATYRPSTLDGSSTPLTFQTTLEAIERIAQGAFKTFFLGTLLRDIVLTEFQTTGWLLALEMVANYAFIYLDFSGYSDIAVGMGRLLGISTPENFNQPYRATTPLSFWERWHISLFAFARSCIFTPLQMYLVRGRTFLSSARTAAIFALFCTFIFTGLWHGFEAGYLVWGLLQAAACALTSLILPAARRLGDRVPRLQPLGVCAAWLVTQAFVTLSFVFTRVHDLDRVGSIYKNLLLLP